MATDYFALAVHSSKKRKKSSTPRDNLGNFRKPTSQQIAEAEKFLSHRDPWDEIKKK